MNRNEQALNEFKEVFKKLFKFSKEEAKKFSDFVLSDGTKITTTADLIEIGVEVYAIDDLGNQTPLNNGNYVLEDGRNITVEDNKVTEISGDNGTETPIENADTSKTVEEKMEEGLPEEAPKIEVEVEGGLEKRVAELEAQLSELIDMITNMSKCQVESNQEMMSKIEEFASVIPGEAPIANTKRGYKALNSTKEMVKNSSLEELRELREMYSKKSNLY